MSPSPQGLKSGEGAEWVPLVKEGDVEEKLKAIESRVELAARRAFGESGSFTVADYEELKDLILELQMDLTLTGNVELQRRAALRLAEFVKRLALAIIAACIEVR
jgi:hypothetical protein